MRFLQLAPFANLTPFLGNGKLVALNVGPDHQLYAAIALKRLDYRIEAASGVNFAKTTPAAPQAYRVVAFHDGNVTLDLHIANEQFNIHDIQPLPNGELLLVCCRSCYKGPEDFDKNGRIYSVNGQFVREILLGDGIQHVQTSSKGMIWTSFFDEGVFGNFGWKNPVGASGLIAWDSHGTKLYEFEPAQGLDSICDCYALNVVSDTSTWLYYYTDFPLVHLQNNQVKSHWPIPVAGSSAFAVANGLALFTGGYDNRHEFHLFQLGHNNKVNELGTLNLIDESRQPLNAELIVGRSHYLYLVRNNEVYRCDVQMAATGQL